MAADFARPRLVLLEGEDQHSEVAPAAGVAPRIVLVPVEPVRAANVFEFSFELARALAAQTARTGAVVYADHTWLPRSRRPRIRHRTRGPLSGLLLEPSFERECVMYFDHSQAGAVNGALRGQMPQLVISDQGSALECEFGDPTAFIVVAPGGSRPEYVELLQSELADSRDADVLVMPLDSLGKQSTIRFGARDRAPLRARAWQIAAELVLEA